MDKVGKLELVDVQARASKAEISSGKNLKEGLLVMLDQEALLKRLKKEREEEEERLKDEVAKKEKEEKENYGRDVSKRSSQEREGRLRKKTDFLRLGYGGPGLGDMVRIADKETDKIYKSGTGFFADLVFGKSIEMYLRGYYKKFEMESTNELTLDPRMTKAPSLSTLTMYGLDYGFRFTIFSGYLFYELWDMYLIGAFRIFNTTKEAADNGVTNTFLSGGVIGGLIFQFTVSPGFGLFAEYNYGYTPVGKTTINVDGHQLYAGINLRVN
jgi:hypothetical protein